MYTLLLYTHILALVYWLGGDLGTFLASRYVVRSDLTVEARQSAFSILLECDMGPKLAMPIILGSGFHLISFNWANVFPPESPFIAWAVVIIWLGLVLAQHTQWGAHKPQLAKTDLALRYAIVVSVLAIASVGWTSGLPTWVVLKMVIFGLLVACGIAVRYGLKPFAVAYGQMLSEGASPETDATMNHQLSICRRYVWMIWAGLFVNTALGVHLIVV